MRPYYPLEQKDAAETERTKSQILWTGVPIDKACGIFAFFTDLELSKSQADSLLSQLATDWRVENDAIAKLAANTAIV
ncbi:MAG: hypothetical protein ABGX16_08945 [Pirellulales bacterium]